MSLRAVIFDFDGVILDTERAEFEALGEIYREHGADLAYADWSVCIGTSDAFDPYAHLERLTGRSLDRGALKEKFRSLHRELISKEEVMPGVLDWIAEAREMGMKLGVASSSKREWVEDHLKDRSLLDRFNAIAVRDGRLKAKPAPDIYLAALEMLGNAAGEAVALEDSANGIASARAAGIFCVAVPNSVTRQLDLSGADLRLESLASLSLRELAAKFAEREEKR